MPQPIPTPSIRVPLLPLTAAAFASFGAVVENPLTTESLSGDGPLPRNIVRANQGSAIKVLDVTHMTNFYGAAPSKQPAKAVMNMFVCSPRPLREAGSAVLTSGLSVSAEAVLAKPARSSSDSLSKFLFDVKILERHPYTPQTFIPLGLDPTNSTTCYLVIVAPTLPSIPDHTRLRRPLDNFLTRASASLSGSKITTTAPTSPEPAHRKGPGLPDLTNIRAFLAKGNQAVTYGAGTWHAPMVVLGTSKVDFVVVQYANGVAPEDCQEVELQASPGEQGVSVVLELPVGLSASELESAHDPSRAKL